MSNDFSALDANALRERYGDFYANNTGALDSMEVPQELRDLIPYAELWGVGDDYERDKFVEESPLIARDDLRAIFIERSRAFDHWLAGPEADGPEYSRAYVAFSNMRIAYDYLSVL